MLGKLLNSKQKGISTTYRRRIIAQKEDSSATRDSRKQGHGIFKGPRENNHPTQILPL
jgi:hypothetical protein